MNMSVKPRTVVDVAALKQQIEALERAQTSAPAPLAMPDAPAAKSTAKKNQALGATQADRPALADAPEAQLAAAVKAAGPEIVKALRKLVDGIEAVPVLADPSKASLQEISGAADAVYFRNQDLSRVVAMLQVLPAHIRAAFPVEQLKLVSEALGKAQRALEVHEAQKKSASSGSSAVAYQSGAVSGGYGFKSQAPSFPEPVLLKANAMADLPSAAQKLGELLGDPGLAVQITAVVPGGKAEQAFTDAVRGAAVLADFVAGTPDYQGYPPKTQNRRDHQARRYGYAGSGAYQKTGLEALKTEIERALAQKDPTQALESAVVRRFIREIGVSDETSRPWNPTFAAVTKALEDEAFVPLRCLNAQIERSMRQSMRAVSDQDVKAAVDVVHQMAQAVVEGRFDEWRRELPQTKEQLRSLTDTQRQQFFEPFELETVRDGRKFKSREGEGADHFWATKTGGPSHGFDDMMPRCSLALMTNGRTKVIMVQDEQFPLNAARAYLKVLERVDGRPILALEGVQKDFAYFNPAVSAQIIEHAMAKAKAMGVDLMVIAPYDYPLHGLPAQGARADVILHPVPAIEASDYLGLVHDEPIRTARRTQISGVAIQL